jgi:hypothetical protein
MPSGAAVSITNLLSRGSSRGETGGPQGDGQGYLRPIWASFTRSSRPPLPRRLPLRVPDTQSWRRSHRAPARSGRRQLCPGQCRRRHQSPHLPRRAGQVERADATGVVAQLHLEVLWVAAATDGDDADARPASDQGHTIGEDIFRDEDAASQPVPVQRALLQSSPLRTV